MVNVAQNLREWSRNLPYWEQFAFDKVLARTELADSDYEQICQYLLEDNGLAEKASPRPSLGLRTLEAAQSPASVPKLVRISELRNINALAPGQALEFDPALTLCFGQNGAGKSGYVRVLAAAGFTRGDREVLPDVTRAPSPSERPAADIEIECDGCARVVHFSGGEQCPELASVRVFDSTSIEVHLKKKNTLSFSPAGLSCLTRLSAAIDKVKALLESKIDSCSQPHCLQQLFQAETDISAYIGSLDADADLEQARQWAILSDTEIKRIDGLDIEIARLKTKDVSKETAQTEQTIADLNGLRESLVALRAGLTAEGRTKVEALVQEYLVQEEFARGYSIDSFKKPFFSQVGSDTWKSFVSAAKALSEAECAAMGTTYPQPDSYCLLCHQPLTNEALELLRKLWAYLAEDAHKRLDDLRTASAGPRVDLLGLDVERFSPQSAVYRYLDDRHPALCREIALFVADCKRERQSLLEGLAEFSDVAPAVPLGKDGIADLDSVIADLKEMLVGLREQDTAQEIAALSRELLTLQHRKTLGEHLSEVESYVDGQKWAHKARKIKISTRHVTRHYNQLFSELVVNKYVEVYQEKLDRIGRPLKVRIETQGQKGSATKQLVVAADAGGTSAPPDKVLSEGEKRIVALTDFLTEVQLDSGSGAIVLDDPVTSLDLEWRGLVASILVDEARNRQVVVFTHDLPFLYFVDKACQDGSPTIRTHWIQRVDDVPGVVFLDNAPSLEKQYKSARIPRETLTRAKAASAEEQESLLRQGFGALRTCYEAFIVFDLFNDVVRRFDERLSFGRLKEIVWDETIVRTVIEKCELLSRYIEGHLHSDAMMATTPTPGMLSQEIEEFEALVRQLKALKRAKSSQQ